MEKTCQLLLKSILTDERYLNVLITSFLGSSQTRLIVKQRLLHSKKTV